MAFKRYEKGLALMRRMVGETAADEAVQGFRSLNPEFERFCDGVRDGRYFTPGRGWI